jgi:hypothetical protein
MKKITSKIEADSTPLILATVLLIFTGILSIISNFELTQSHLFGFIALSISIYTYFNDKVIYKYFFFVVLILGMLNYLDISFFHAEFSVGKNKWISIDPLYLGLLIFFFIFNSISKKK